MDDQSSRDADLQTGLDDLTPRPWASSPCYLAETDVSGETPADDQSASDLIIGAEPAVAKPDQPVCQPQQAKTQAGVTDFEVD